MRSYMSANQLALYVYIAQIVMTAVTHIILHNFFQCYMKLDVTPMGREMLLIPNGSCNDSAKATNEIWRKSGTNLLEPDF
jgi:hypothetical protein